MGCLFCGKVEKSSDSEDYFCSHCVAHVSTLTRDQIRELIDKLYLADKVEKAEFIEKFVTGTTSTNIIVEKSVLKIRTIQFKGLKPQT